MLLPHGAVVAVLDGAELRLFRNAGRETGLRLEPLAAPDLEVGPPGSGGRHRSSSANPDHGLLAEDAFAAAVAGWLNRQVAGRQIEQVVVIASPRTLGELRLHYADGLRKALLGEVAKELVDHDPAAIEAAIVAAR